MRGFDLVAATLAAVCSLGLAARGEAPRPAVKDLLGICGHTVMFKPELYAPVCSLVRDYHPVEWDLGKDTAVLPEWPFAKNKVSWEGVYGSWVKRGFRIDACLMFETEPADKWKDLDKDAAAYGQSLARRFGPSSKLPLLEAVEIGNEPGKWSDEKYTQVMEAFSRGIRAGDAKLKIATCNMVVGKSHAYAKSVSTVEKLGAAYDVLTIHTYAQLEGWPTWKRSYPEDPKLAYLKDVRDLAAWRDEHAKGKPIWITEFGYDATTKSPDPKTEFAKWVGSTETQQAQYLVRSVLVFATLPVERAYIYFFDDNDDPHVHGSSGITRKFAPKPAYWALVHLQQTLGDFRFSRALAEKEGAVYAYEFVHATEPGKAVIVAWSPTGSGRAATVALELGGRKITRAERMPLGKGDVEKLEVKSAAEVPITESPLFLFVSGAAK